MTDSPEALTDRPTGYWPLSEPAHEAEPTPDGHTLQAGHPITDNGDIAIVTLDALLQPQSAYVNGEPVSIEHPYVAKLVDGFEPRLQYLPEYATGVGAQAIHDRALSAERIREHYESARRR